MSMPPPPGLSISKKKVGTFQFSVVDTSAGSGGARFSTSSSTSGGGMRRKPAKKKRARGGRASDASARGRKVQLRPGHSQLSWMMKVNKVRPRRQRRVPMAEVRQHASRTDCWMVVRGIVYDVTPYMNYHPGGNEELMRGAGDDATALFEEAHKWVSIDKMLRNHIIGPLLPELLGGDGGASTMMEEGDEDEDEDDGDGDGDGMDVDEAKDAPATDAQNDSGNDDDDDAALHVSKWRPFTLVSVRQTGAQSKVFTFALPAGKSRLGLDHVGEHLQLCLHGAHGRQVIRAYTPISLPTQRGTVDLAVKLYPTGRMSRVLDKLCPGQNMYMRGPRGEFEYHAHPSGGGGCAEVRTGSRAGAGKAKVPVRVLVCVAAGSGITPMFQVIRAACEGAGDKTRVLLVYANRREEDMMLRAELDALASGTCLPSPEDGTAGGARGGGEAEAKGEAGQLTNTFVLSEPPADGWTGEVGRVDEAMVRRHVEAARRVSASAGHGRGDEGVFVTWCGPPTFNRMVEDAVQAIGVDPKRTFEF